MDKYGYLKLYRAIMEHWIYDEKPYDKCHAWLDILLSANFSTTKRIYRGKLQITKAGQLQTSLVKLSKKWGWSREKVARFIRLLERDGMITANKTPYGTTLTVENWGKWQGDHTALDTTNVTADKSAHKTTDKSHNKKGIRKDKEYPLNPPKGDGGEDDYLRDVLRRIGRGEQVD